VEGRRRRGARAQSCPGGRDRPADPPQ